MPKKPKSSVENKSVEPPSAPSTNGNTTPEPLKKKARAAAPSPRKRKPAAPKKSAVKQSASTAAKPATEPTDEQIRLRAYFLAERRHKLSLPGDSNHDWIEARRQLIEEAQR